MCGGVWGGGGDSVWSGGVVGWGGGVVLLVKISMFMGNSKCFFLIKKRLIDPLEKKTLLGTCNYILIIWNLPINNKRIL